MCNRSATLLQQPPTPNEPVPKDDVESVKAIEEAVLEVLPTAQQNFALTRDGAKVLASNPGAKKVGAILDDDTDTYMRNECQDDKWVVLELSQVAKISRIELIQHELYSSRIKDFEIRGRQSHPRTDNVETSKGLNSTSWKLLGKFTAEKAKGTQQFNVERPIWAHYLLIRFLTHYGNEPVLLLLVQMLKLAKKSILDSNNRAVGGIHTKEDPQLQQQKANEAVNGENAAAKIEVATSVESKEQPLGKKDAALASADKLGETTSGIQNTDASTQASFKEKSQQPSDARNSKDNSTAPTGTVDSTIGADGSSTESPSTHLENRSKPPAINITNTTLQAPPPSVKHIAATTAAVPAGGAASNGGAGGTNKLSGGGSGGGGRSLPFDVFEPLPVPKTKTGGGVYDVLVQEIRVTKAQQRVTAKALEALQRNLTAASIALSRMKTEYEVSELDLEKKVDSMISEKLNHYETEMIGLRKALKRAAKREHAALSLLAMLGGALVLSMQGSSLGENWPKARTTVLLLALANGAVGVALQWT
ncbi:hypothetical protein KSW81_007385 [Nannochloris sp. 'desiccata']|nr:hypothetical protein KSW81_007385 [Chlorella desiccata (nom. nud.)]